MARAVAASFDAIAMVAIAFALTGGSFDHPLSFLWGAAAAAVVAALAVLGPGLAAAGWAAIGYVLFLAFLLPRGPLPVLGLLALAYMPILPRPRGSLGMGLLIAAAAAAASAALTGSVP